MRAHRSIHSRCVRPVNPAQIRDQCLRGAALAPPPILTKPLPNQILTVLNRFVEYRRQIPHHYQFVAVLEFQPKL